METLRDPVPDEVLVRGFRAEKEIAKSIARMSKDSGRPGAEAANRQDARERERKIEERRHNRAAWAAHYARQRRAHLELALEARRKARQLREVA